MKNVTPYLIPITLLIAFILLMNSGNYFKSPRGESDRFELQMNEVQAKVESAHWKEAKLDYQKLTKAWHQVVPRIQFSVEKNEINAINVNLARLEAYLASQDRSSALAELSETREHWIHLND